MEGRGVLRVDDRGSGVCQLGQAVGDGDRRGHLVGEVVPDGRVPDLTGVDDLWLVHG